MRDFLRRFWPWRDPDPPPPVTGVDEIEVLKAEAERRRQETLAKVRRQRRVVHENHFADDVKRALEATR